MTMSDPAGTDMGNVPGHMPGDGMFSLLQEAETNLKDFVHHYLHKRDPLQEHLYQMEGIGASPSLYGQKASLLEWTKFTLRMRRRSVQHVHQIHQKYGSIEDIVKEYKKRFEEYNEEKRDALTQAITSAYQGEEWTGKEIYALFEKIGEPCISYTMLSEEMRQVVDAIFYVSRKRYPVVNRQRTAKLLEQARAYAKEGRLWKDIEYSISQAKAYGIRATIIITTKEEEEIFDMWNKSRLSPPARLGTEMVATQEREKEESGKNVIDVMRGDTFKGNLTFKKSGVYNALVEY